MTKRNPWEPRPLLDENPWSLFPGIGLTTSRAWVAQALWTSFAATFLLAHPNEWQSTAVAWIVGVWAVFYVTQRLGGREAWLGGTARVTPDSMFQIRLLGDLVVLIVLIFLVAVIVVGIKAIRNFGGSL